VKPITEAFPEAKAGSYHVDNCPGYVELLESTGWRSLIDVEESDYQGSTYVLCQHEDGRYGFTSISWGSCSGCDALQACNTLEDLAELRDDLLRGVQPYATLAEAIAAIEQDRYLDSDDSWHGKERAEFKAKCRALLDGAVS